MTPKVMRLCTVTPVWGPCRWGKNDLQGHISTPYPPLTVQTGRGRERDSDRAREREIYDLLISTVRGERAPKTLLGTLLTHEIYTALHESFLKKENLTSTFYSNALSPLSTRLSTGHSQIKKQMFTKGDGEEKTEIWLQYLYTAVAVAFFF